MEENDLSLSSKLDKILEGMETLEAKQKKFKLPWSVRMKEGKLRKGEHVVVLFVRNTGAVNFKVVKVEDGTVKIGEYFFDASAESMLRYKKKPLLIIKEWDMKPFSPREEFEKTIEEGTLTAAQKLILLKLKTEAVKPKMKLNMGVILILLALGAGILILLNYLKVI